VNGQGLFDPLDHDLRPFPRITSCWRGYVCEYKVHVNEFLLNKLQVNLGVNQEQGGISEEGPLIHGIKPVLATSTRDLFNNTYQELNLRMEFTGGILAADDFIQELYVHMGFHPAWKYKNVIELIISHGHVIETRNVSGIMQEIRNRLVKSQLEPGLQASKEEIEAWVAATFKLDYRL
jgi:hypothetical protein